MSLRLWIVFPKLKLLTSLSFKKILIWGIRSLATRRDPRKFPASWSSHPRIVMFLYDYMHGYFPFGNFRDFETRANDPKISEESFRSIQKRLLFFRKANYKSESCRSTIAWKEIPRRKNSKIRGFCYYYYHYFLSDKLKITGWSTPGFFDKVVISIIMT